MKRIIKEIKMVFKYGDPILLVCVGTCLVGGLWFLYVGISGLIIYN